MPQSSDALRAEFMSDGDDGILTCKDIIRQAGGMVDRGFIAYDGEDEKTLRAIQFLIEEWDFAYGPKPAEIEPPTPEQERFARNATRAAEQASQSGWLVQAVVDNGYLIAINPDISSEIWLFYNDENVWRRHGEKQRRELRKLAEVPKQSSMLEPNPDLAEANGLFQQLWTMNKAGKFDRPAWKRFEVVLNRLGIPVCSRIIN